MMIPHTLEQTKGRDPTFSGRSHSTSAAVMSAEKLSPIRQQEQICPLPLRRVVSYPEEKLSTVQCAGECSSSSPSTPSSSPSTKDAANTGTIRKRRPTPTHLLLFTSRRQLYLWFLVFTVTYMHLTYRTMNGIKSPAINEPLQVLRQIDIEPGKNGIKGRGQLNNNNDSKMRPRVVFLSQIKFSRHQKESVVFLSQKKFSHHQKESGKTFQNEMGFRKPPPSDKVLRRIPNKTGCAPKADWHSFNFVNCNSFHEISFASSLAEHEDTSLDYMFRGGTRETWLFENTPEEARTRRVILKTLRYKKDYDEVRFNRQRIDALASERLKASPHVIQTYGFCGMSTINEFADGGHFGRYFASSHANLTSRELLAFARDAALGLADIHEVDGPEDTPTLVHHDLSPKNLLLTADNRVKISDFNDAQLLHWNFRKNKGCGEFFWDGLCGTTVERTNRRAPEECDGNRRYGTTERTEVYHLGTIFHFLLSREQFPYQFKEHPLLNGTLYEREPEEVKKLILNGTQPPLPPEVEESADLAIQVVIRAMRKAFTFDASKRPSAREIANLLQVVSTTENNL